MSTSIWGFGILSSYIFHLLYHADHWQTWLIRHVEDTVLLFCIFSLELFIFSLYFLLAFGFERTNGTSRLVKVICIFALVFRRRLPIPHGSQSHSVIPSSIFILFDIGRTVNRSNLPVLATNSIGRAIPYQKQTFYWMITTASWNPFFYHINW